MNLAELSQLLETVTAHQVTATDAIRRLVAAGHEEDLATELVFIALGGGDIIEVDPDGTKRYEYSGRTVAAVDADMKRA